MRTTGQRFRLALATCFAAVWLTASGCANGTVTRAPGEEAAPLAEDAAVTVYAGEVPSDVTLAIEPISGVPAGRKVGSMELGGGEMTKWDTVLEEAKTKARELGGDVVVIESWGYDTDRGSFDTVGGRLYPSTSRLKELQARVILRSEDPAPHELGD